jgi:CRISPR/Cas system CSM-associated protein Csm2 small subunit
MLLAENRGRQVDPREEEDQRAEALTVTRLWSTTMYKMKREEEKEKKRENATSTTKKRSPKLWPNASSSVEKQSQRGRDPKVVT